MLLPVDHGGGPVGYDHHGAGLGREVRKPDRADGPLVTHVFSCLITIFSDMMRSPINYFKFVLDPVCFGTSIENMFHVSFLVKGLLITPPGDLNNTGKMSFIKFKIFTRVFCL
jgi:hypothetical protein